MIHRTIRRLTGLPARRCRSAEEVEWVPMRDGVRLATYHAWPLDVADAPTIKSYAGPVLLGPGPAGILFHEVLGHRLEGSRLLSSREGQTFKRDLGKQILPQNVSIYDDPTIQESAGCRVVGHYRYEAKPAK